MVFQDLVQEGQHVGGDNEVCSVSVLDRGGENGLLDGQFAVQGFMGFVGVCELLGGIALVAGLWTRLVAVLGSILLIGAYATAHMGNGLLPIQNRGELALLYVACFAILFVYGARSASIEWRIFKRELF